MERVLTFKELPADNSSFGNKTITAELVDGGVGGTVKLKRTVDIQVFYPATASNSPSKASDPNWFTYYKDAAGGGSYQYDGSLDTSQALAGGGEGSIKIAKNSFNGSKCLLVVTNLINSGGKQIKRIKVDKFSPTRYYYRNFIGHLEHERQHALYETTDSNLDTDDDFLSTNFEETVSHTDPQIKNSASLGSIVSWDDGEVFANVKENEAYQKTTSDSDWASPGGQY